MKNKLNKRNLLIIIAILAGVILTLGALLYKKNKEYSIATNNEYNMAFYELVDYMQNVEGYLAESIITESAKTSSSNISSSKI